MKSRDKKRVLWITLSVITIIALCITGYILYDRGRPTPVPAKRTLFDGDVTYHKRVYYLPRLVIAHVLTIDTKAKGFRMLVTPPDNEDGPPLNARTTTQFLDEFGVQIAINGDGFYPWWSYGPLDYYPEPGDPVTPNGYAVSRGKAYSDGNGTEPVLYVTRSGSLTFRKPNRPFFAIAGDRYLIEGGEKVENLDDSERDPRTALGFNKNGRWLYLVVVDGRQPFYSAGATFDELADILLAHGAHFAMSLDGGGSTTMVVRGADGEPVILNSPIDQYVPGRERPVANHLGIYFVR
ncbi:MAG: phosphodiester glycosidase family protein [Anaerolineales bacterium]